MILFSLLNIFSLVSGLETAKYPQIKAIGDRIEFWFAVECKIRWKNIFEATSCY